MEQRIPLWPREAPYAAQSPGQQPYMTPFPVPGARGAVIVLPGGGYEYQAEHEGAPVARLLNSAGIAAFVLYYRVHPCHCDAPGADARRAVRAVRAMGYEKVALLGFSAGGHVCCTASILFEEGDPASNDPLERLSSRPDAFLPCYSVVSFGPYTHMGSRKNLLGDAWEEEALAQRFSMERHVTGRTPPAFLWHTAQDGSVPVQNSLMLARALADHGVPFEMHVYPWGGHGIGLGAENAQAAGWGREMCRWLLEGGFGK